MRLSVHEKAIDSEMNTKRISEDCFGNVDCFGNIDRKVKDTCLYACMYVCIQQSREGEGSSGKMDSYLFKFS